MAARRPGEAGTSFGAGRAGASPPPPTLGQWEAVPCHSHGVSGAQWRGVLSPGAELTSTDLRESTQFKERCPERERVTSYPVPRLSACRALQASRGDLGGGGPGPPCCRHSSLPPPAAGILSKAPRTSGKPAGESAQARERADGWKAVLRLGAWGLGGQAAGRGPPRAPPGFQGPGGGQHGRPGGPESPAACKTVTL